ncbi:MAG: TRAM domain-containing protein [Vicinamibacterales bacterium]
MTFSLGDIIELTVDRPVPGGDMLARVGHATVFVSGGIPGERVRARVRHQARGVSFATVVEVLDASPDRREVDGDAGCGGRRYAHIAYDVQRRFKRDVILDAFSRVGRGLAPEVDEVVASPETGYRVRAGLHLVQGRLGFYREGTHTLCDARQTGQLLPATFDVMAALERSLAGSSDAVARVDLVENLPATMRALSIVVRPGAPIRDVADRAAAVEGIDGIEVVDGDGRPRASSGTPWVFDTFAREGAAWRVRHRPGSFFQANRHLLPTLVEWVVDAVADGPVVDLYAGVGVFGVAIAASRGLDVLLVEADARNLDDLRANARPWPTCGCEGTTVERCLRAGRPREAFTVVIDPPRAGLSAVARAELLRTRPARIVYVSCDPATFARDARELVDAGYALGRVRPLDLFPGTAHVELVAAFEPPQ